MSQNTAVKYTLGEEIFNAVSHGVGAALAVAGCVIVVVFASFTGNAWAIVSCSIYSAMTILAFLSSTLYHSLTAPKAKAVFRVFDHNSIFLFIAGTYTPFTLVTLRGTVGWTIFCVVWGASIIGIILNSISIDRFKIFSMIAYVATGWAIIFAIFPLSVALPLPGIILLIAGGVSYTLGIIFYAMKKIHYMHSIWHLFVLAGSILHYFSILFYVVPGAK